MSTNATAFLSEAAQTLEAIIHPSLVDLMLSHTFSSLLIPLMISLFYFSTQQTRRTPIFILNVVVIILAFFIGVLCAAMAIHGILEPLNRWPVTVNLSLSLTAMWQYILVDLALLVRVISVYPLSQVGVTHFTLLIAIPVLIKLARVTNLILFTKALVDAVNGPDGAVMVEVLFVSTPYIKIEWAAQMIDNAYASVAFLRKLSYQQSTRIVSNSSGGRAPFSQRVRTLFKIALANFVIPTMFSIAQFVCLYRDVSMRIMNDIMLVNTMVATFGVAFATVWAGSTNRHKLDTVESNSNNTGNLMFTFGVGHGHGDNQCASATTTGSRYTAKCSTVTITGSDTANSYMKMEENKRE